MYLWNDPKNLKDFCPMYYKNSHGRNPSNFWGQFLEIDDFINSFWFYLTSKVPSRNLQLLTRTLPGSSWIEAGPKLYHLSIFRIFEQKICFSLLLRQFFSHFLGLGISSLSPLFLVTKDIFFELVWNHYEPRSYNSWSSLIKFIYSEKATKFWEIFTLLLS